MTTFVVDWSSWSAFVDSLTAPVALRAGMWLGLGCLTALGLSFVMRGLGLGRALVGGAFAGLLSALAFLLGGPPLGVTAGHIAAAGILLLCLALTVIRATRRTKDEAEEDEMATENLLPHSPVHVPPPPVVEEASPAPAFEKPMQPARPKPAPLQSAPEEPSPAPAPTKAKRKAPAPAAESEPGDEQLTSDNASTEPEAEAAPPPPPKKPRTAAPAKPASPASRKPAGGGLDWLKDHV